MTGAPTMLARAGIVAIALVIAWRIVQVNAVLYEDTGRPRLPAPRSGVLGHSDSEAEALAQVLRANPAQVAALLVMARDAEAQSRPEAARRAYEAAYRLAPLDREVLAANAEFLLRQGEVGGALALFDRLADAFPEARERVFPVLGEILAAPEHAAAWNAVVARRPSWLGPFVAASCARGVEPSLLVPLFLMRVKDSHAVPAEAACLVERLRNAERWDEAYQVWLNTLPRDRLSDVGFVYNGSFEYAPSGTGFDWVLSRRPERETGFSVEIAQAPGAVGKRALRVSYAAKRQHHDRPRRALDAALRERRQAAGRDRRFRALRRIERMAPLHVRHHGARGLPRAAAAARARGRGRGSGLRVGNGLVR